MDQIKIFSGTGRARLEDAVNKFLKENADKIIVKGFKFSTNTISQHSDSIQYSILIEYYERCEME